MKTAKERFPNPKNRGEWAEMRFMARAAEEGFRVSKPWGDSARYDFAVEENGRFLRIQVKSTIFQSGAGYMCSIQPAPHSQRYTPEQVDYFAAYVIPEDVWYILPTEIAAAGNGQIQLSPKSKKQKYAAYKEAWHLLHEAVGRKDAKGAPEVETSAEDHVSLAEAAVDPEAEPGEIPVLRGAIESSPSAGFDADLVRSRFAGCFERILKRR